MDIHEPVARNGLVDAACGGSADAGRLSAVDAGHPDPGVSLDGSCDHRLM